MEQVTISPKFQVVIPKSIREKLHLRPGQKLLIYEVNGNLRLSIPRPFSELRGMAKGIKWEEGDRDRHDRY